MPENCEVLIIGGGVIGACCAYEVAVAGGSVTLLERREPPAVDSGVYANAGLITPSDAYPLAAPGALGKGARWLLDSGSPFYVAPLADKDLPRWLALFAQYARDEPMRLAMPVQRALLRASADLHAEYAQRIGEACGYRQNGWLWLYETEEGFAGGVKEISETAPLGVVSEIIDAARLPEFVPGLAPAGFAGGRLEHEDAHCDPLLFTREVVREAVAAGARLCSETEVLRLETGGRRVSRVVTTKGDFTAQTIVLAAGAWSAELGRQLGLRLPIQAAKGYSVDVRLPEDSPRPELPLYLGERSVVAIPLGERLRFAGTLELAGLDLSIRWKRVARLREGGERIFPGSAALEPVQVWRGLRPCTPDGLPIIGRSPAHDDLIVATGHCMLGLGEGPVTGRLVAQLIAGTEPQLDIEPFRVDRFPTVSATVQQTLSGLRRSQSSSN